MLTIHHHRALTAMLLLSTLALTACGGGDSGGGGDNGGGGTADSTSANIAFVTSVTGTGDLSSWADAGNNTGLAAGDAICQSRAEAAGLAGTYVAWLSDTNDDAYCRVHGLTGKKLANCGQASLPVDAGPWVRTDGFPFSSTVDRLTRDSVIYAPLRYDEYGVEVSNNDIIDIAYYTATNGFGVLNLYQTTCMDWTASGTDLASAGSSEATSRYWTDTFGIQCDLAVRLACFAAGTGISLPAFSTSGKTAFVTSALGNGDLGSWPDARGNTGIAAGDAICQARAQTAGLTGTFKAWLSDSHNNAVDRLVSNGPWVRLDGVKIADNKADLTDGRLFTAISVDDTGTYRLQNGTWSGTDIAGNKSATTCSDWHSSLSTAQGTWGSAQVADDNWTENGATDCSLTLPLYCFED